MQTHAWIVSVSQSVTAAHACRGLDQWLRQHGTPGPVLDGRRQPLPAARPVCQFWWYHPQGGQGPRHVALAANTLPTRCQHTGLLRTVRRRPSTRSSLVGRTLAAAHPESTHQWHWAQQVPGAGLLQRGVGGPVCAGPSRHVCQVVVNSARRACLLFQLQL